MLKELLKKYTGENMKGKCNYCGKVKEVRTEVDELGLYPNSCKECHKKIQKKEIWKE